MTRHRYAWLVIPGLLAIGLCGCSGPKLVPTPNLYADSSENPYAAVPPPLQTSTVPVLYATDRMAEPTPGGLTYKAKRSRAIAFGVATMEIGNELGWPDLVSASRTEKRPKSLPIRLAGIDERGHVPAFPAMIPKDGTWVEDPAYEAALDEAEAQVHRLLGEHLAHTPRKEVFLFVHGYNNTFETAVFRVAQLWHYLGRVGVPAVYSWPAGSGGGMLRGYTTDRESGEFTNWHLKQILRAIASCPEVRKVHVISHSRGTDVMLTALKELHIEHRAAGRDTRAELKLGHVILAAPDIDLDVFVERFAPERIGFVPEQVTVYVSPNDKAIGISGWLFGGLKRLGRVKPSDLDPAMANALEHHPIMSLVEVKAKTGFLGHGYFTSSPAVLSDLILVLRDSRRPGAANGRPLVDREGGFWELHDGYPAAPPTP